MSNNVKKGVIGAALTVDKGVKGAALTVNKGVKGAALTVEKVVKDIDLTYFIVGIIVIIGVLLIQNRKKFITKYMTPYICFSIIKICFIITISIYLISNAPKTYLEDTKSVKYNDAVITSLGIITEIIIIIFIILFKSNNISEFIEKDKDGVIGIFKKIFYFVAPGTYIYKLLEKSPEYLDTLSIANFCFLVVLVLTVLLRPNTLYSKHDMITIPSIIVIQIIFFISYIIIFNLEYFSNTIKSIHFIFKKLIGAGLIGITIYAIYWGVSLLRSYLGVIPFINIFSGVIKNSVIWVFVFMMLQTVCLFNLDTYEKEIKDEYLKGLFVNIKFLKEILCYIPCLFLDIINYIRKSFGHKTPASTKKLLIIEAIILLIYFIVYPILKFLYRLYKTYNGYLLLKGPVYLDQEITLDISKNMLTNTVSKKIEKRKTKDNKIKTKTDDPFDFTEMSIFKTDFFDFNFSKPTYQKNILNKGEFAISFWLWIDDNARELRSIELFKLGTHNLTININYDQIEFFSSNNDNNDYRIKLYSTKDFYYQKWNSFIINYTNGTLDIFINDKLRFSKKNVIFNLKDNPSITLGAYNINGGIKNLIFYDKPLSRNKIHLINNF